MSKTVEERVISLIANATALDEAVLTGTDTYQELGLDSLDRVDLAMAVEDEFNIIITDEQMKSFETISDTVSFIEEHLAKE